MFVFIIPLKSRTNTDSWIRLSLIFERTLRSVCSQTSTNSCVIVVCNQLPEVTFEHSSTTYIKVEDNPSDFGARDKWKKIKVGLIEASKLNPTFVMHCDADDCVSNKLVEFTEKSPDSPGWYFPTGWFWQEGSLLIFDRDHEFHTICGTCRIINFRLLREHLDKEQPLYSHKDTDIYGTSLHPLPFRGSVYIRGHGENLMYFLERNKKEKFQIPWFQHLKQGRFYRPITGKIRREFGLYNLN